MLDCSFHGLLCILDLSTHPQKIEASMSSSSVLLSPEDSFVELSPKCTKNLGVFLTCFGILNKHVGDPVVKPPTNKLDK